MIENETQTRFIGYGAMLMECFVAIMAMIAASVLEPGVYFAMNSPAGRDRHDAARRRRGDLRLGLRRHAGDACRQIAQDVGEKTHPVAHRRRADARGRHGADPLAVIGGKAAMAFWYHFAILFEALFILTTVDAGTRVARFMIQDLIGTFVPAFRQTQSLGGQPRRDGALRDGLGLLPLPGRHRSARRHQHAVAAVRHLQPDAGRHRADALHRGALQDEARALRLGHDHPDRHGS